jgi:hypothetical protein
MKAPHDTLELLEFAAGSSADAPHPIEASS